MGGGHPWPPPPDAAAKDGRRAEEGDGRRATPPAASAPASEPDSWHDATWSVGGTIGFKDMVLNLGEDAKKLTGKVSGTGSRTAAGLDLQAKFDLDKLQVGPREITELHGHVNKAAKSLLIRMEDLSGKAYGGLVTGTAQVKLVDPLEYGIRVDVEGVDLNELLNAGVRSMRVISRLEKDTSTVPPGLSCP